MKGLKYTILPHGFIENDLAWNVAMPAPATRDNKSPTPIWGRFPTYSVLISHPTEGYILFDTGSALGDDAGRRPASMDNIFPLYIKREEYLDKQLEKLGLSVEDISLVVCSHMHWDHSGGLCFFAEKKTPQKVLTSREDYAFGAMQTLAPYRVAEDCAYFRENYLFKNLDISFVEEDDTLCEGIDMILLQGHTPAVLGLVLYLESGTVIFPSDAIGSQLNYDGKLPGIIYDSLGFKSAVRKVRKIQQATNGRIVFPHDAQQFSELRPAPYFYE